MDKTQYGTVHELFRGSGIVDLSQIDQYPHPDPFHHCTPEFKKERKRLEQQFRHEACKPWLGDNHLKAHISALDWEGKTITGWKTLGGYEYPCLRFDGGVKICIIERLALLEVARSSSAWGLAQVFGPLEPQQRWWVLDFFRDDGSNSSNAASQSQYTAVMNGLGSAKQRKGGQTLSYMASLMPNLKADMDLVGVTPGVREALAPLFQIPSMWLTRSFGWLNSIRTSWCNEEVINYVKHIVSQWEKITLQWDPTVVQSFDPESIETLQSRAPLVSTQDHDYIVRAFKQRKILTQLTDARLREAVKTEVCRQGPILTLATFATDLRQVKTWVHDPLTAVLGKMRRPQDTLREKVCKMFGEDFDVFSHTPGLNIRSTIPKTAFVESCYQRFFLDALRARRGKRSINRDQLCQLAKCEFIRLQCHGLSSDPSNVDGNEGNIVIATSDDTLPSDSDWQDIDVEKRHGFLLFDAAAARNLLNIDRIHEKHPRGFPISKAFMGKYIARIFLFGSTVNPEASPVSPMSPRLSLNPVDKFLKRLPFGNRDSVSVFTADGCDSVFGTLSDMSDLPDIDTNSVLWRRPHVQMVTARSEAASMTSSQTSLVELEETLDETKKRPRVVPWGDTNNRESDHLPTTGKRQRSVSARYGLSPEIYQSVEDWVGRPLVLQHSPQVPSIAPSISEETYHDGVQGCETRETEARAVVRGSFDTRSMDSPSMYSPNTDRCSVTTQVRSPEYRRSSGRAEAYTNLLREHNPFSSDRAAVQQAEAEPMATSKSKAISQEYTRVGIQGQLSTASQNQTSKSRAGTSGQIGVHVQATRDSTASIQLYNDKFSTTESQCISYRLIANRNISYCAPSDACSIERFVRSQKSIDPHSTFSCFLDGKNITIAPYYKEIQIAIGKYGLDTIYVGSNLLGSTDSQKARRPPSR